MMINDHNTTTPDQQTGDSWLKALEAQSWQAELLLSGGLVAGLFQLPDIYNHWVSSYLIHSSGISYIFILIASMFVFGAIISLTIYLIFHLFLRGIWIALLGLNSVYPEGINIESKIGAGPTYWKKLKEQYHDLSSYNKELDNKCSLIFSNAIYSFLMLVSFSVLIMLFFLAIKALLFIFPSLKPYIFHIGIGIYLIFLITSLITSYLSKRGENSPRVENFIHKFNNSFSDFISLYIFRKPINFISGIIGSNSKLSFGKAMLTVFAFFFFIGVYGGYQQKKNPIFYYFKESRYMTFNNRPYTKFNFNYENLKIDKYPIFSPIIPKDVVTDKVIPLFIPIIDREKEAMNLKDLSFFEKLKIKRKDRNERHKNNLQYHEAFNQIYMNGNAIQGLKYRYYNHPNCGEEGIIVNIPTSYCQEGDNVLEIRKNYFVDDIQKIVAIPFYLER